MTQLSFTEAIKGLNLSNDEASFVCQIETLHTLANVILDRFNQSDFAYKSGRKAQILTRSKGLANFYDSQDRAANTALLNTARGALHLMDQIFQKIPDQILKRIERFVADPAQYGAFRDSMFQAYIAAVIQDHEIDGLDAVWGSRALDYHLAMTQRDGFQALVKRCRHSFGQFVRYREDLDTGRGRISDKEFAMAAPYFTGDDRDPYRRRYDLVHVYGFDWIKSFKVVIRLVCYIIIFCFISEEEEIIEEIKKIWVCKWVDPSEIPPWEKPPFEP